MWCRNVLGQLSAYADGELTPAMTQQVREHLAGCDRCAREHAGLRSLATLTAAIPFEEVPGSLHQRIMASLSQATFAPEPMQVHLPRRSARPLTWAWAAFATGVIAVACGTLQHRSGSTPALATSGRGDEFPRTANVTVPVAPRPSVSAVAPKLADVSAAPLETPTPAIEAKVAGVPEPAPVMELKQPSELIDPPSSPPASARLASTTPTPTSERPQPAAVSPSGKLATEPKVSEPGIPVTAPLMARENLMTVPGDPIVNNTGPLGPPEPVVTVEKEAPNRMVGMAMETESPGEEDEGLRSFRMFLQENNRTVPQPPSATPVRERRMRKSL